MKRTINYIFNDDFDIKEIILKDSHLMKQSSENFPFPKLADLRVCVEANFAQPKFCSLTVVHYKYSGCIEARYSDTDFCIMINRLSF